MSARAVRAVTILVLCMFGVAGLRTQPHAQSAQTPAISATEQAALEVARGWVAGWNAKDLEKVGSYMAEDLFWSGGFPTVPLNGIWRTRDRFKQQDGDAVRRGVKFTMAEVLAVGGSQGTAILHRRVDQFGGPGQMNGPTDGSPGRPVSFINSVFFWIKDGKIQIWLDGPTLFPPVPVAQAPPLRSFAPIEQRALDTVKGWVAAWNARDPDKVASYMEDDALFSADYPSSITEAGKAVFLKEHRQNIVQGVEMQIAQSLAIGGPMGAAVLLRRIDRFSVDGQQKEVPTAAFFWVRNGRIYWWLDLPLEPPPTSAAGVPVVR